ncbi:MAG TPA: CopD family protein [Pseudolabrys sp.]|nr:CopD family protein [Pseudolabrys sp.]
MTDLLVIARAVHFAATISVLGTVAFEVCVLTPALRQMVTPADTPALSRRLRWLAMLSLIVAVISAAAWLALFAGAIGAADADPWRLGVTVLTQTQFGRVSLLRLAIAVVLGILIAGPSAIGSARRATMLALATLFAVGPAASGHAGAVPGSAGLLTTGGDVLHIAAASFWLGGLLPLVLVLARARRASDPAWGSLATESTQRFSLFAIAAVGTLIITGLINAVMLVGSIELIFSTPYGRVLAIKIALFFVMLCFAAVNLLTLTPALPKIPALAGLQRNTIAEAGLGIAVITLVGLLGTLPPAAHHHVQTNDPTSDTAFVHLHGTAGMAEVTITPGHPGPVDVKVSLLAEDFAPLAARSVILTLSNKSAGFAPQLHPATEIEEGRWRVDGLTIPAAGAWDLVVEADLDGTRKLNLDGPVLIEP